MLLWQGNLEVQWPEHGAMVLKVQLWCANFKSVLQNLNLEFLDFVHPNLTPFKSIRGPALSVYSEDSQTIAYFSEMAASQLGLLVSASSLEHQFDHFIFYSTDQDLKVYARPLILNPKIEPLEPVQAQPHTSIAQELNSFAANTTTSSKSHPQGQPKASVQPKVLRQVVLGALRMRGYNPGGADYEQIFKYCYKTTELVLMRQGGGDLEMIKERVEAYLKLFD